MQGTGKETILQIFNEIRLNVFLRFVVYIKLFGDKKYSLKNYQHKSRQI